MSAPFGPAPGCKHIVSANNLRIFGSDSSGNVYPRFCDCRWLISGGSTLMPTTRTPRASNSESLRWKLRNSELHSSHQKPR